MKKVILLLVSIVLIFSMEIKAQDKSSISKIQIDLSKDSLTQLNRVAVVSEFYIGWSVNQQGNIDSSGQFINIYCNIYTIDVHGNPITSLTYRKPIQIKQGTPEFDGWFNAFDSEFKQGIIDELNLHKTELEKQIDQ